MCVLIHTYIYIYIRCRGCCSACWPQAQANCPNCQQQGGGAGALGWEEEREGWRRRARESEGGSEEAAAPARSGKAAGGQGGGGRVGAVKKCGKNSMQEARAQREREERKRKQAAVGRVDKRDNGVVVAAEVAGKLRVGVGSTVIMFSLDM